MIALNLIHNRDNKLIINGVNISKLLEKSKIGVYIDGAVNNPGFIQIPKGKTLEYVLNEIGGVTKEAEISRVNLKQVIKNGEKIFIPSKEKSIEEQSVEKERKKININTAGIEDLKKLDGIGDKIAKNIIEYRKNKKFENIDEIKNVKGIGNGKFEKIKNSICS